MSENTSRVEKLETGIAAAVHEIDELRAENARLSTRIEQAHTVAAQLRFEGDVHQLLGRTDTAQLCSNFATRLEGALAT
ncbi:hypothetical protein G352_23976 [Rhodococcus ruber BKS 20-38]|uniref:Uncharacterized protein n=1 Tax=Rhodococcus ruber BKS 20-38 TaxID=1278076 RepID=M2YYG9_9NOCA|nr:hypothetical protein [Rhodococcus ruber]EME53753.1 hypothetical protein G352_23976 [Rhodococcus ruber BKS 20-38]